MLRYNLKEEDMKVTRRKLQAERKQKREEKRKEK
jgi:hypothetical protein